jgi:hypothetical protein
MERSRTLCQQKTKEGLSPHPVSHAHRRYLNAYFELLWLMVREKCGALIEARGRLDGNFFLDCITGMTPYYSVCQFTAWKDRRCSNPRRGCILGPTFENIQFAEAHITMATRYSTNNWEEVPLPVANRNVMT